MVPKVWIVGYNGSGVYFIFNSEMSLNVKRLIKKAQDLINDDDLPSALEISYLVQKMNIGGHNYELRVSLEPEHMVLEGPSVDPRLN